MWRQVLAFWNDSKIEWHSPFEWIRPILKRQYTYFSWLHCWRRTDITDVKNTLAGLSGDAHFDDAERFTTGTKDGINLDWVALHEIGHSLGLEHSNVRESVMYPWYKGYQGSNIELTNDDILGIRALYPGKSNLWLHPLIKISNHCIGFIKARKVYRITILQGNGKYMNFKYWKRGMKKYMKRRSS